MHPFAKCPETLQRWQVFSPVLFAAKRGIRDSPVGADRGLRPSLEEVLLLASLLDPSRWGLDCRSWGSLLAYSDLVMDSS